MKVLLTGSTGFLGYKLLAEFIGLGYQVIITKRATTNLLPITTHFGNLETCDTTLESIQNTFMRHPDIDAVVHAATDYGRDTSHPTTTFWANESFPVALLEQAIERNVKIFINIDTFFNIGKENYDHLGAYTLSKRHFQEWGKYCGDKNLINFVNLRLFHLYGPGDSLEKFVPSLVSRCLSKQNIDLTDGSQKRDFIHINDAIAAISLVLTSQILSGVGYRDFDLGTGRSIKIRDFIEKLNALCDCGAHLNFGVLPQRKGEFQESIADISRLNAIGWSPKLGLEKGLQTVIDDIKKMISIDL